MIDMMSVPFYLSVGGLAVGFMAVVGHGCGVFV